MWIVRWIVVFVVLVVLLWFSLQNLDQSVTIAFWKYEIVEVPMIMALFVSFIVGAFVWFVISLVQIIQMKAEMAKVRREKARLERELADLRNFSIEEDTEKPETETSGPTE